jgi:hypothetical protein
LAAGRSYITNGPLLEFTLDREPIGSVLDLPKPREVAIHGRAVGRVDFKRIELVENGRVVQSAASRPEGKHFVADLDVAIAIDAPAWLALRTPPPPVKDDPELQEPVGSNEFGRHLFAHTSPIYLNLAGQGVFDEPTARGLLAEMKSDMEKINEHGTFKDDHERHGVLHVYEEAIGVLEKRLAP